MSKIFFIILFALGLVSSLYLMFIGLSEADYAKACFGLLCATANTLGLSAEI